MSSTLRILRIPEERFVPSEDIAVEGRAHIYTQVGEWVVMMPISHLACRVYWLLRAHCNRTREGAAASRAFPSQKRLAAMCGLKRPEQIAAAVKELEAIGAVTVHVERYAGGMRQHNVYYVHLDPPEGFTGCTNTNDYVAPGEEQVSAPAEEKPQVTRTPDKSGVGTPRGSGSNQTKNNQTKKDLTTSPPAGRHADARRRELDEQKQRRQDELPADSEWKTYVEDELADFVLEHVDDVYGCASDILGFDAMVRSMADRDVVNPDLVMNTALKAARIHVGIQQPDPVPAAVELDDPWAVDDVWALPSKPSRVPAERFDAWAH